MPTKPRLIVAADRPAADTKAPRDKATLRDTVKESLLTILEDPDASAAAKASAGRTLLEYFSEESATQRRRGADMSAAELDEAIAAIDR